MRREREAERIARVYQGYRDSQRVQRRWDERNPGNAAILAEREIALQGALARHGFLPLAGRRILEVGCGSGQVLAGLRQWGAQPRRLYGIDLLPDRIDEARRRYPELRFQCGNAEGLAFRGGQFDLVLVFTVFSSVLDEDGARRIAREIMRVLAVDGAIGWYDVRCRNPANPQVRAMVRPRIARLFPGFDLDLRAVTLLPPLARRLGRGTEALYPRLAALPGLRTHYLGLLRRAHRGPPSAVATSPSR